MTPAERAVDRAEQAATAQRSREILDDLTSRFPRASKVEIQARHEYEMACDGPEGKASPRAAVALRFFGLVGSK